MGQPRKLAKKTRMFDSGKHKAEKKSSLPTSAVVIGFFLFVVVGSAILQIIRTSV